MILDITDLIIASDLFNVETFCSEMIFLAEEHFEGINLIE